MANVATEMVQAKVMMAEHHILFITLSFWHFQVKCKILCFCALYQAFHCITVGIVKSGSAIISRFC